MTSMLDGNVDEVRAAIAEADLTVSEIEELHDAERASGKGPGGDGRKGVLDALEEKRGEAALDAPSPGLAREPMDAEPAPDPRPFTVDHWAGQPLYRCKFCTVDRTEVGEIMNHVALAHPHAQRGVGG